MINLTIDGRQVSVAEGTTILAAAGQLGIRIPTLCHVAGTEPAASCFLCAVQIEGRRALAPACAMPAAEGMVVDTGSADVRSARKIALELLLSDHAGECVAPCAGRCPAGLDIPGFVYGIAAGDNRRAMEVIGERLALPGSLGRICPRLCERECRRCGVDEGLAIASLHRHAAESARYVPPRAPLTGKSVAIVGAGPAGLAAAWHLLRNGHDCTVYDAHPLPGGMLRYGIPAYRLPKDALDAEIRVIRELGARFHVNQRWGKHFTLADLRERHNAVFLAIGAQRAQDLQCEGEEQALPGVTFLELVANGNPPPLGDNIVVIGGGNTAVDCARSALRLGASNVRILYRRSRHEMPCLMEEVEAAETEGVRLEFLTAPIRLERNLLTCRRMALGDSDASGRRRPVPVAGSDFTIECSAVISAIGQVVETALARQEGLHVTSRGIAADERTLATNLPGVFAGGDAVLGADLAVRAEAAGRIAAASIHHYLSGEPVSLPEIALRALDELEFAAILREIEKTARVPDDPVREARRCLTCGCRKADCCRVRSLATEYEADVYRFSGARRRFSQDLSHPEVIYEPGKCINCEACVRIAAAAGEQIGLATIGRGFNVRVAAPFGAPLADALRTAARRAAEACPTGALALRTARSCDLVEVL